MSTKGYLLENDTGLISLPNFTIRYAKLDLTSADILALATTPIEIIAASGAGKTILPLEIMIKYTFVTTAYSPNTFVLSWGSSNTFLTSANILNSGTSTIRAFHSDNSTFPLDNTNVSIRSTVAPLLGDGTMTVYVAYVIMSL